jgi:carbamoyltransferase
MYILGINAYHGGASACLIHDGQLIAAVEEERFSRIKYQAGFPVRAIQHVLQAAGITPHELDHIGIGRDPSANLLQKVLYSLGRRPSFNLIRDRLQNTMKVGGLEQVFCELLGLAKGSVRATFHNVEHHRAHMASAFLVSPFTDAAILSVDGSGDFITTMWGTGKDNRINPIADIPFPHSLGNFYTAFTQWLGFPYYGDEGKIMGLAPYGEPTRLEEMRKIVRIQRDGSFELDLDFFQLSGEGASMTWTDGSPQVGTLFSEKLVRTFGPARQPKEELTEEHRNVAASLQHMLEEAEFALVRALQKTTGAKVLCMAGGVALNSAFNGKVLPQTEFEDIFIQPAAGDAGTALGVCYYIYNHVLGHPRSFVMRNSYTGPEFSDHEIASAFQKSGVKYEKLGDEDLARTAAKAVAEGNVVGWFQGKMEWGPRALGHRSIIADPRRDDMKEILNARIKRREPFRPFAPSILEDAVGDYFDQSYPDPFMVKVYNVRPEKIREIPAVTHVDGTGRLQTVSPDNSPTYFRLIDAFREETGIPVVLNTSFNENEPIVCNPEEAIGCFLRTKMDALAIGNHLARK